MESMVGQLTPAGLGLFNRHISAHGDINPKDQEKMDQIRREYLDKVQAYSNDLYTSVHSSISSDFINFANRYSHSQDNDNTYMILYQSWYLSYGNNNLESIYAGFTHKSKEIFLNDVVCVFCKPIMEVLVNIEYFKLDKKYDIDYLVATLSVQENDGRELLHFNQDNYKKVFSEYFAKRKERFLIDNGFRNYNCEYIFTSVNIPVPSSKLINALYAYLKAYKSVEENVLKKMEEARVYEENKKKLYNEMKKELKQSIKDSLKKEIIGELGSYLENVKKSFGKDLADTIQGMIEETARKLDKEKIDRKQEKIERDTLFEKLGIGELQLIYKHYIEKSKNNKIFATAYLFTIIEDNLVYRDDEVRYILDTVGYEQFTKKVGATMPNKEEMAAIRYVIECEGYKNFYVSAMSVRYPYMCRVLDNDIWEQQFIMQKLLCYEEQYNKVDVEFYGRFDVNKYQSYRRSLTKQDTFVNGDIIKTVNSILNNNEREPKAFIQYLTALAGGDKTLIDSMAKLIAKINLRKKIIKKMTVLKINKNNKNTLIRLFENLYNFKGKNCIMGFDLDSKNYWEHLIFSQIENKILGFIKNKDYLNKDEKNKFKSLRYFIENEPKIIEEIRYSNPIMQYLLVTNNQAECDVLKEALKDLIEVIEFTFPINIDEQSDRVEFSDVDFYWVHTIFAGYGLKLIFEESKAELSIKVNPVAKSTDQAKGLSKVAVIHEFIKRFYDNTDGASTYPTDVLDNLKEYSESTYGYSFMLKNVTQTLGVQDKAAANAKEYKYYYHQGGGGGKKIFEGLVLNNERWDSFKKEKSELLDQEEQRKNSYPEKYKATAEYLKEIKNKFTKSIDISML